MNCIAIVVLSLCVALSSCTNPKVSSGSNQENYPFTGNWQGDGDDSQGNKFTFFGKVSHSGGNRYQVLILDKLDTLNKPIHSLNGILENNKFSYTADESVYEGSGTLSEDMFEGYYKGPVDGTFKMWRLKQAINHTAPD